jgi:hypothetical protein
MRDHPLTKPTVLITSLPALRLRRATRRLIGPKRRLRKVVTAVLLVAIASGIGALYRSHIGDEARADNGNAYKASSSGCQSPGRST